MADGLLSGGIPAWSPEGSALSVDLRGRALFDIAEIDTDLAAGGGGDADSEFRALRFGAEVAYGAAELVAEFDFADDDIQPADLLLEFGIGEGLTLAAGHFKETVSLDEQTSSLRTSFMERSSITDAFGLSRRVGVRAAWGGQAWSFSAAAQGGTLDGLDLQDDGWALSSRATFAPVLDEGAGRYLHLGGSVRYRDHGPAAPARYSQRPMAHLARPTVRTGRFADRDLYLGAEAALGAGPFHAQAELAVLNADGPGADAGFAGGYAQAGWFVTGERRPYSAGSGGFSRVTPQKPVTGGGPGAVELAARLDWIDLDDGPAPGGTQTSLTLAANWHPTARTRISANYVAADIDGGPSGAAGGDIAQMRFQFDW